MANTTKTDVNFYGFTVVEDVALSALAAPTVRGEDAVTAYDGDETGVVALASLPPGYYPIRGSSITLASGSLILWIE